MRGKYRVTYDSNIEPTFLVHTEKGIVKFPKTKEGIYAINMKKKEQNKYHDKTYITQVNTVNNNLSYHSRNEQVHAKRALALYNSLGMPTVTDLKNVIRMNLLQNNSVTSKDLDLMEEIYGRQVASLKGVTTRRSYKPSCDDTVELPMELRPNKQIKLAIDIMFVNDCQFLVTIAEEIYYRSAHYVASGTSKEYAKALSEVIQIYNQNDYYISKISCDNEFRSALELLKSSHTYSTNKFILAFANPQQHVPQAERNIQTIKEKCGGLIIKCLTTIYHKKW